MQRYVKKKRFVFQETLLNYCELKQPESGVPPAGLYKERK